MCAGHVSEFIDALRPIVYNVGDSEFGCIINGFAYSLPVRGMLVPKQLFHACRYLLLLIHDF
jgi:hypothetical protein